MMENLTMKIIFNDTSFSRSNTRYDLISAGGACCCCSCTCTPCCSCTC